MVTQIEQVIGRLDDRMLRQQEELHWLASDNRQQQKRESGLMVILTGFDPAMEPADRLYQINWMIGQLVPMQRFLQQRAFDASDSCKLFYLGCLMTDPSTPPAGEGRWSTVTTLQFKSWDLRKEFMAYYGGSNGTPLYRDESTPVRNHHTCATPASPQFQRKLELPIRALLATHNMAAEAKSTPPGQLTILWRTLTLMAPSESRDHDPQAKAWARMHYFEHNSQFQGRLEVCRELYSPLESKPPQGAEESTLWDHAWNKIAFGVQLELDRAEKEIFNQAHAAAKGGSKGISLGKSSRHYSSPLIYSSEYNPFPTSMTVIPVDEVFFSWDEYCDKTNSAQSKTGSYAAATSQDKPPLPVQAKSEAAASMPPPSSAPVNAKSRGRGRGSK